MEWPKDLTMKLIELLQVNARLWNPGLCERRKDKLKRRAEQYAISEILGLPNQEITKKIQHLRTQYTRESVREERANARDPNERYVSTWYAYECLHFMKDSSKPYRVVQTDEHAEARESLQNYSISNKSSKYKHVTLCLPHKPQTDSSIQSTNPDTTTGKASSNNRDELSIFGEYIASELRSLKAEKDLLVTKKKIQDIIFDVKMGIICETRTETTTCTMYTLSNSPSTIQVDDKVFRATAPVLSATGHVEHLSTTHSPQPSSMSDMMINGTCHYPNYKVNN